ncbi:MAG: hypothetical protein J5930_01035 [Treponema sp.]|nr:hypothetical protein [Treponema sp.]
MQKNQEKKLSFTLISLKIKSHNLLFKAERPVKPRAAQSLFRFSSFKKTGLLFLRHQPSVSFLIAFRAQFSFSSSFLESMFDTKKLATELMTKHAKTPIQYFVSFGIQ